MGQFAVSDSSEVVADVGSFVRLIPTFDIVRVGTKLLTALKRDENLALTRNAPVSSCCINSRIIPAGQVS
jgi:hypothetical protein